ncbi:MAG TPA: hypothetical protein P5110_08510 [Candidatus Omnitrophota bacterium]|nr:hypothetical protein [Candidatus Omnitrophota bacterium]HRZ15531.1 hypothetical protein [Candidatus Omnitrophota bacterium]
MKYTNIILTVIAVLLAGIALRLFELKVVMSAQNENARRIIDSNQAVINSQQRLETSLGDLRKQIADIGDRLTRK